MSCDHGVSRRGQLLPMFLLNASRRRYGQTTDQLPVVRGLLEVPILNLANRVLRRKRRVFWKPDAAEHARRTHLVPASRLRATRDS
jgi:hypothetical protein